MIYSGRIFFIIIQDNPIMGKKNLEFMKIERRQAERFQLSSKVSYKSYGGKKYILSASKDISGKGIRLVTKKPLMAGDKITVAIHKNDKGRKPLIAVCEVVWSKECSKNRFETGLIFAKIYEQGEFLRFICENMVDVLLRGK